MNSLSVALRAGYLSVRTAEGTSEKQSSLKARLRNGLTYLLTYLLTYNSAACRLVPVIHMFAQLIVIKRINICIAGTNL